MRFLITKFEKEHKLYTVHFWEPENPLSDSFWSAGVEFNHDYPVSDYPSAFITHDDYLFVGLSSSRIDVVNLENKEIEHRLGPRWTEEDYQRSGRNQAEYEHRKTFRIRGFAVFQDTIFDACGAGLYETLSGNLIDNRFINTVEVINDKLCMVPYGENARKQEKNHESEKHIGDLVNAHTKEVLVTGVEPFDGSGFAPGKHFTHRDKIYIHHGDYPGERITIKTIEGKTKDIVPVWSSDGFVAHQGVVYDIRWIGNKEDEKGSYMEKAIFRSDCSLIYESEADKGLFYKLPREFENRITGIVSGGNQGSS